MEYMKINKMFSIDIENAKKLESLKNKSKLIDALITEYFIKMENPVYLAKQLKAAEIMAEAEQKAKEVIEADTQEISN